MNRFDKLIGWVAPERGLRRLRARAAFNVAQAAIARRGFDGARQGPRAAGWQAGAGSANAELVWSLDVLRNRARDLVRNNPYIKHALKVLVGNMIGTGIVPKFDDKRAAALWATWSRTECDAGGLLGFAGLQAQIVRAMWESGECLVRFRNRRAEDGLSVPLQLEVLEADYLDTMRTGEIAGGYIIAGVQFNLIGQRVGYWLFDRHPGEIANIARNLVSRFVPASEVLHLFDPLGRPGMVRGLPEFAVSIWKARDLDEYQEAELVRKKIEACFAVFVKSDDPGFAVGRDEGRTNANAPRVESLSPGMVEYLRSGESVEFSAPSSGEGYEDHVRMELRAIAAGAGITYEQLTGDYSQVNFTSGRMGKIEFKSMIEQFQWLVFVPMLCDRVAARWVQTAYLAGALRSLDLLPSDWTAPRIPLLDPLREGQGYQIMRELNVMSRQEIIRELGYDPDLVDSEIATDKHPPQVTTPAQAAARAQRAQELLREE